MAERQRVLIVVHADGFLEAFASPGVDVRFADMPSCGHTPHDGAEFEVVAEQFLETALPLRYRQLYDREIAGVGYVTHQVRTVKPSDIAAARAEQQIYRILQNLNQQEHSDEWIASH